MENAIQSLLDARCVCVYLMPHKELLSFQNYVEGKLISADSNWVVVRDYSSICRRNHMIPTCNIREVVEITIEELLESLEPHQTLAEVYPNPSDKW